MHTRVSSSLQQCEHFALRPFSLYLHNYESRLEERGRRGAGGGRVGEEGDQEKLGRKVRR